jgi:hypothetical protein
MKEFLVQLRKPMTSTRIMYCAVGFMLSTVIHTFWSYQGT